MMEEIKTNLPDLVKQLPYIVICFTGVFVLYGLTLLAARYAKNVLKYTDITDLDTQRIKENVYTRLDFFVASIIMDVATTPVIAVPFFTLALTLYYSIIFFIKRRSFMSAELQKEQKIGLNSLSKVASTGSIAEAAEAAKEV